MKNILNVHAFLGSIVFFSLIFFTNGCQIFDKKMRDSRTDEAEKIIKDNPEYREVDKICKEIPIPENSKLVGKARLFNSVGISNYYYSEVDSNLLRKNFEDFFIQQNWEQIDSNFINPTLHFQKKPYEVKMQFGGIGRGISYSINCAKISSDKKN